MATECYENRSYQGVKAWTVHRPAWACARMACCHMRLRRTGGVETLQSVSLMTNFATMDLPERPTVTAPDGSDVRVLLRLAGGSMAHFELAPGRCSQAVRHRTVEELWYVIAGEAEMWRCQDGRETVVALRPGTSLSIPLGTAFQFRAVGTVRFEAVAVTMPPWPGMDEAEFVAGTWPGG